MISKNFNAHSSNKSLKPNIYLQLFEPSLSILVALTMCNFFFIFEVTRSHILGFRPRAFDTSEEIKISLHGEWSSQRFRR